MLPGDNATEFSGSAAGLASDDGTTGGHRESASIRRFDAEAFALLLEDAALLLGVGRHFLYLV